MHRNAVRCLTASILGLAALGAAHAQPSPARTLLEQSAAAMGGLTMMASTFINAEQIDYEAFKKETQEIVKYVQQKQAQNGNRRPQQQPRA